MLSVNSYKVYNRPKACYCWLYSSSWPQHHFERSTETQPAHCIALIMYVDKSIEQYKNTDSGN